MDIPTPSLILPLLKEGEDIGGEEKTKVRRKVVEGITGEDIGREEKEGYLYPLLNNNHWVGFLNLNNVYFPFNFFPFNSNTILFSVFSINL